MNMWSWQPRRDMVITSALQWVEPFTSSLSMIVSNKRQIGVDPVLFDAIVYQNVWCSLAVSRAQKRTNVRNERKILCLVPRLPFSSFSSCRRLSCWSRRQDTFRDEWKRNFQLISEDAGKKCQLSMESKCGGLMMLNNKNIYDASFNNKETADDESKHVPGLLDGNWISILTSLFLYQSLKCAAHPWYVSHINGVATQRHRTDEITQTKRSTLFIYFPALFKLVKRLWQFHDT